MTPYLPCEIKSGKRLNPKPRQAPLIYQRYHQISLNDDVTAHEGFIAFLAIFTTLGFAMLCAAIA